MATVNITKSNNRNIPTNLNTVPTNITQAGKSQDFILKFESADENSLIMVANMGTNTVTVSLADNHGNQMKAYTVDSLEIAAISIESGGCKRSTGDIKLTIAPSSAAVKLSECDVFVAGISTDVVTH